MYLWLCYLSVFVGFVICTSCSSPNGCSSVEGMPYCVNGTCMECDPTYNGTHERRCMCSPGEYCVGWPTDPDYGTCKALEENILGRNCDKTLDGLGLELVQGFNDTVFCGNVVFDNTTAVYIEWEGACIQSTCRQCITSLAPTLPNALCEDGRCCYRGNEVIANVGVYSLTYAKESPLFTGFYATIIVLIIVCPIILFLMALIVYYYVKATNSAKEDGREVHFWYDFILDLILW